MHLNLQRLATTIDWYVQSCMIKQYFLSCIYHHFAPCMDDGKCNHYYPHVFSQCTKVNNDGYPIYMCHDDGRKVQVKGSMVDNHWIVPFNPFLSMKYKAHINVEVFSMITTVKYLYKYVYKGHDRAAIKMLLINPVRKDREAFTTKLMVSSMRSTCT